MKRLIFVILLFFPFYCNAGNPDKKIKEGLLEFGPVYFHNDITLVNMNRDVINYLTANLENIISTVEGDLIIYIPIQQEFKKKRRGWIIGRHLFQYEWENNDIKFDKIKTTLLKFDFCNNTIDTLKNQNNDDLSFLKDKTAKDKIKEKDKKGKKP